ncbi:hypothetical protein GCM10010937_06490 [Gluconobacter japonicus]|uniref:Uncharacterized protein n=1 Tax=Gluconobacter japonicus TaxID=376620 RepID=A0ABQ5WH20_GLUJA|nr:hypothetical protein GCM10010937_06490 [Gluconobacter japonicus]
MFLLDWENVIGCPDRDGLKVSKTDCVRISSAQYAPTHARMALNCSGMMGA